MSPETDNMKKSAKLFRFEPVNMKWAEEILEYTNHFNDGCWYSFFERIMVYNI